MRKINSIIMSYPLIFDVETQYTFRQYSQAEKLKISVVAAYDYGENKKHVFEESDLPQLFTLMERASIIIGFNIISFDLPVLKPYYAGDLSRLPAFDILDDIKLKLGHRLSLNDLISATLGKKKTGHGLQAIEFYKEGKMAELKKYCLDDVLLTKELFDYGVRQGE